MDSCGLRGFDALTVDAVKGASEAAENKAYGQSKREIERERERERETDAR